VCAAVKADRHFLFADGNICRHIDEVAEIWRACALA
jgi:hypothetical protein